MTTLTKHRLSRPPSAPRARPRWCTPRTPSRPTLGPRVAQVAEMVGIELMEWQREVLDTALEIDPETGQLVYREVRITVPRQSGKTTLLLALMTHRCIGFGERQRVAFTMQSRQDARQKLFEDYMPLLDASPLGPRLDVRESNGMERIRFPNSSIWGLVATTEKAGHGPTVDLGVVDEAFAQPDGRLEQAIKPSQITRGSAQFWIVSTAGTTESHYFNAKTRGGREMVDKGSTSGVYYCEFSASPKEDPADHETWYRCMPALGVTIPIQSVQADYDSMELDEFKRAYLNITQDKKKAALWAVIKEEAWRAILDTEARAFGPMSAGIDVNPAGDMASVSISSSSPKGGGYIEVLKTASDTGWILDYCTKLYAKNHIDHFVIDKKSGAAFLIPDFRAAGLPVLEVGAVEYSAWCADLNAAIKERTITHRGQGVLTASAASVTKRPYGDAFLWNRRAKASDITPFVSATLAYGAHNRAAIASESASGPIFAY